MNLSFWKRFSRLFLASALMSSMTSACSNSFKASTGQFASESPSALSARLFVDFQNVITKNCNHCHGGATSEFGGIVDFTVLQSQADWINHPAGLIVKGDALNSPLYSRLTFAKGKVANQNNNMPFATPDTPVTMVESEAQTIADYINSLQNVGLFDLASCEQEKSAAQVDLRRLNAAEIRNAIADVFGLQGTFSALSEGGAGQFGTLAKFQTTPQIFIDELSTGAETVAVQVAASNLAQYQNCTTASCMEPFLSPFAELLFRKALTPADKNIYLSAVTKAFDHPQVAFSSQEAYQAGIMAMLLSPQFLYVIREGSDSGQKNHTSFELASRLALLFYRSVPDRQLWQEAQSGQLTTNYDVIVDRLANSQKFYDRFSEGFARGWLGLDRIDGFTPNAESYGIGTAQFRPIAEAMKTEVIMTIKQNLQENRSIDELVIGNTRYINSTLNNHLKFGANIPDDGTFTKYELPASSPYAGTGVLTMTPLVSTSLSDRNSIVFRGQMILEAFTCRSTPPPPDDVIGEIEENNLGPNSSQREILQVHSESARCAACHSKLDPYGFGLEHFDGLGRFRTQDQFGNPVDAKGQMEEDVFTDHKSMAQSIVKDEKFTSCVTQMSLTYAINKGIEVNADNADRCATAKIGIQIQQGNKSLKELIKEVAKSSYFKSWLDELPVAE